MEEKSHIANWIESFTAESPEQKAAIEAVHKETDQTMEELIHQAFENIRQFIAEGLTPEKRVDRALWVSNVLQNKEPLFNEEWDTLEENRKTDAK